MNTISVLMAVYNPNPEWLREQLLSLERQTRRPDRLYVRDDASPAFAFERLRALVAECVPSVPAQVERNAENRGSNATFALLTETAEGDCFAYCDQDDAWEPQKLEKLEKALLESGAQLACCDLSVMDGSGRQTADSVRQVKPHIVYRSGEGLAPVFLTTNFVTGCACLVRADAARAALPFPAYTVHDQWIALTAARRGGIVSLPEPLVRYRIHGENQTPTLRGVQSKADYARVRIGRDRRRVDEYHERVDLGEPQRRLERWMNAREGLARHEKGAWRALFALRGVDPKISWFELAMPLLPEGLFRRLVRAVQHGKL
ncbi:MAG: glycosyltransferase [Eubacteriales bacterium]|nr:glycosyltransferase [Eubacteriales bacterium]